MITLGIDPGSRYIGYGFIKSDRNSCKYLHSGVIKCASITNLIDRLDFIYEKSLDLTHTYKPDDISIESLIYVKNVSSLLALAQARGAMLAAFSKTHRNRIFEYAPNLIKSTVSGYGHASKGNVGNFLNIIFKKEIVIKRHDETDALAIAVCHAILKNNNIGLRYDSISAR